MKFSQELKDTLLIKPEIKEVHFTADGNHWFHKNKDVEYETVSREDILGAEETGKETTDFNPEGNSAKKGGKKKAEETGKEK